MSHRAAHRLRGERGAVLPAGQNFCQRSVGGRLPIRDLQQQLPYGLPEGRTLRAQRREGVAAVLCRNSSPANAVSG